MEPTPLTHCPECGAPQTEGDTCLDRYYLCLALEPSDPRYAVVHSLTVPAYNLQHPHVLSAENWVMSRTLLGRFLNDGATPQQIRAEAGRQPAGSRDGSLTRGPSLHLPPGFTWQQTIPALYDEEPTPYGIAVIAWAKLILQDADRILIDAGL